MFLSLLKRLTELCNGSPVLLVAQLGLKGNTFFCKVGQYGHRRTTQQGREQLHQTTSITLQADPR